jgi:hypothetical protein
MSDFDGFPPGELRTTPLPDLFFSAVLPATSDSAELRVTLHVFWQCHRRRGRLRAVAHDALLADATLRRSLSSEANWQAALERGLKAAVGRGTLLRFLVGEQPHYAPNTAANRALLSAAPPRVERERPPSPLSPQPAEPTPATRLYERYIGLVTPIVAQELADAEREYPQQWLADAFAQAAERGHRHWPYVQAILRGWASGGRR